MNTPESIENLSSRKRRKVMSDVMITKDIVKKVMKYKNDDKYINLTANEVAILCGVSIEQFNKILSGEYDYLLSETPEPSDFTTVIPYEELKHLVACENAITAMLNMAKLSDRTENTLFIDYRAVFSILAAYVPDRVNDRLEALKNEC